MRQTDCLGNSETNRFCLKDVRQGDSLGNVETYRFPKKVWDKQISCKTLRQAYSLKISETMELARNTLRHNLFWLSQIVSDCLIFVWYITDVPDCLNFLSQIVSISREFLQKVYSRKFTTFRNCWPSDSLVMFPNAISTR